MSLNLNNKLRIKTVTVLLITYQGWQIICITIYNIYNTESGVYEYLPTNFLRFLSTLLHSQ